MKIHPSAIVHPDSVLGEDVEIGPHCIIGAGVTIGARTRLISHVILEGFSEIGEDNLVFPFCSIGTAPQDLKYKGEPTRLALGSRNTIREFVTINRGTQGGHQVTCIGSDNLLMAYAHVAHDCVVGSRVIMANAATLAGHVDVMDGATVGASTGVHQFCRVGKEAFVGGYSVITRDALPYIKTVGDRNSAKTYGINSIGLERKQMPKESIAALQQAYRRLFQDHKRPFEERLAEVRLHGPHTEEVLILLDFMTTAERGFIR